MREVILLGPQTTRPRVAEAVERLQVRGRVCAVTAGWQERAGELDALREHLGREVVHLRLYHRTEEIFEADGEFFRAHRRRQNQVRELQNLYRQRLNRYLEVTRWLETAPGEDPLLVPERRDALETVRRLDQHHLARLDALHREFDEQWRPGDRPVVVKQREKVHRLIARCGAVLVAGGHVAVLLNRLRLFDFATLSGGKPIVAWSAGAMVLGEKIVLFHDSPPQGAGDAEVLERGLSLYEGLLVLPHARRRLRLTDPLRVSLFASRFHPLHCLPFDEEDFLERRNGHWRAAEEVHRLDRGGGLEKVREL